MRCFSVDPLAEAFHSVSPFNYGLNNPVLMVDPDGMAARYNWSTGKYEDGGKEVSFDDALRSVGENGCPPNCPQGVAKSDATSVAGKIIPFPENINWRVFANILVAAKMYE